jgi:hypothetical protein
MAHGAPRWEPALNAFAITSKAEPSPEVRDWAGLPGPDHQLTVSGFLGRSLTASVPGNLARRLWTAIRQGTSTGLPAMGSQMETHREIMSFPRTCLDWLSVWASASRSMGNVSLMVTVS